MYSATSRTDTKVYAGLSWQLDGSNGMVPDLVLGIHSLNVDSLSTVIGADINFRMRYVKDVSLDSLRLSYVGGSNDIMGNAGLGYSFTGNGIFGTLAAQTGYARVGGDYQFDNSKINPYLEFNTLYNPVDQPQSAAISCPLIPV